MIGCYCRVSTDEQAREGISLDEQENRLKAYCVSQGWTENKFYIDDGYSAKNTKRPQIQKLIHEIQSGIITKVLVTKIDRFTRSLYDMLDLHKIFDEYNVTFCSASEAFDTSTSAGRMMLNILTTFAQFERERISERVTDNMVYNANQGKLQQPPVFGYNIAEVLIDGEKIKKFIVNEEEREWALQIFKWYVEDNFGYMKIAKLLNENEIKTKKNGDWSAPGVKAFLKNDIINGKLTWNKRNTKKDKWKIRDESEWIITENAHEAIIPLDLWYKAQFKLSQNLSRGTQSSPHMLKGLIKCGHCGGSMVMAKTRGSGGKTHHLVYMCSKYRQGSGCFCNYIMMDKIEAEVIEALEKISKQQDIERIEEPSEIINIQEIQNKLNKIKSKIDLQMELLESKDITLAEFRIARERINKEKMELELKLSSVNDTPKVNRISMIKNVLPKLKDKNISREEKRKYLEDLKIIIKIFNQGKDISDIIFKN